MSASDEAAEEVTEAEFMEAFLKVLQGAFRFALKDRHVRLYEAAIERQDNVMFTLLEELDLAYTLDFTKKAAADQEALVPRADLLDAAVAAANESELLANICEDLAKVKHYCAQHGIASTSFTTEDIMRWADVQSPAGRLLRP